MNNKPSMFSLISSNGTPGATTINQANTSHHFYPGRPCSNCTCSPGLLSRPNRRSSVYLKRMNIARSESYRSSSTPGTPRRRSVTTSPVGDTSAACVASLELKEVNTSARLEELRNQMKRHDLGVYVVPSEDAHQSEWTAAVDQRRAFISGFSGSAGVAVITDDATCMNAVPEGLSVLATDGRYFTQAAQELDFNWELLKQGVEGVPTWQEWSVKEAIQMSLDSGKEIHIGIDPKLITLADVKEMETLLADQLSTSTAKVSIVAVRDNLIDAIWDEFEDKPKRRFKDVLQLAINYTGETTESKLARLQATYFDKYHSHTMVLNALDEIAWLLNMRGDDIEYNPLFYSYLVIQNDKLTLYTDRHERFDSYQDYLKEINCELKGYDEIWQDIRRVATDLKQKNERVLFTKAASWRMANCILARNYQVIKSPIQEMKEVKNKTELQGQIRSQIKDGYALIRYFAWLERHLTEKHDFITEYEAGLKLLDLRSELDSFKGLSFETISSTGANGAIIHYAPRAEGSAVINPNKLYVCDSGAQFLDGTTDTTRTLHFGEPTEEEITNYTLVLKGHIALARLKFPEGETGFRIDCIARQFLWQNGLDYMHGTGHGVDSYGPCHSMGVGIGFRAYCNENTVKAGHLISDEPGYYKPGEYGIRIENMMFAKYDPDEQKTFNGRRFLMFETTTKVPYCHRLINVEMLTQDEKDWLNEVHSQIWDMYNCKFDQKGWEWQWLRRETLPL